MFKKNNNVTFEFVSDTASKNKKKIAIIVTAIVLTIAIVCGSVCAIIFSKMPRKVNENNIIGIWQTTDGLYEMEFLDDGTGRYYKVVKDSDDYLDVWNSAYSAINFTWTIAKLDGGDFNGKYLSIVYDWWIRDETIIYSGEIQGKNLTLSYAPDAETYKTTLTNAFFDDFDLNFINVE